MKMSLQKMFLLTTMILMLALTLTQTAKADTIKLANGRTIHGKVASDEEATRRKAPPGSMCVTFKNRGWIFIRKGQVVSVEVDDKDDFEKN